MNFLEFLKFFLGFFMNKKLENIILFAHSLMAR